MVKRSEINKALKELEAMCEKYKCYLPPFCHFTPKEWESKGHEYDEAGTQIRLTPGESIYIYQGLYHDFEIEPGTGDVLLGEVSQCNDDNTDNRFNPPVGRFPAIEEDEPPYRLLCNEYPPAK